MATSLLLLRLSFCLFTTGSLLVANGDSSDPQEGSNFNSSTTVVPLLESNSTTHDAKITSSRRSTPERILYVTSGPEDDYYYDTGDDNNEKPIVNTDPAPVPSSPCLYDRCEHLGPTCEEIRNNADGLCLCPGISGPIIKPDPPRIWQVNLSERKMTVNWCSPLSTVHGYKLMYGNTDGPMEISPAVNVSHRSYQIENLLPGARYIVCVVAFNKAGESPADVDSEKEGHDDSKPGPCRIFYTTVSKESHIYLGVGLGLAALVGLLVVLGYWLWRRQRSRKRKVAEEEDIGIPNHFYKPESINQL